MIKLKEQYQNIEIYVSFENRNILGKFIDVKLYPHLYNKYPNLFDVIEDKPKKTIKTNVNTINNTEQQSGSNIIGEDN